MQFEKLSALGSDTPRWQFCSALKRIYGGGNTEMVALKTERRVYMWRVMPHAVPKDSGKAVTLDEIIDILRRAYDAEAAEMYLADDGKVLPEDAPEADKDRKNRVYFADLEVTDDTVTILINRGDPLAADPAFINSRTDAVNPVRPGEDESQGWSAHLVLSRIERRGEYRACFERMPHSTSSYTERLIQTIVSRAAARDPKYTYEKITHSRGKTHSEVKPYRPELWVKRVPSEKIIEDLDKGEVSNITLIKSNASLGGLDSPNLVKSISSRLIIKPSSSAKESIRSLVSSVTRAGKDEGYNEIQINMEKLPGNATASPRFSLEIEDATETLYVRTQRLTDFKDFLQSCYAKIEGTIQQKMLELIADHSKW